MNKKSTKISKKSLWESTRPLQIAALVIVIAVGGVMIFSNGAAKETNSSKATAVVSKDENSKVVVLTDATFDQITSEGVVLVDFWAVWCPPCRVQNPIIEQLANEMGDKARIGKLDVDHNPQASSVHQVQNIPTLLIFKDGKVVQRFVGVQQKETLIAAIESHMQ